MNKEIVEVVKKRIRDFNDKHNTTAEFLSPIKSTHKVFAIYGNQDELEQYHDELHNLFNDLEIYCNIEFMNEMPNGYKSILYCYELNKEDK